MELGEAQGWFDEYVYRHEVVPGLPRDAYLDEDGMAISWLTRIHEVVERVRADKHKAAQGG